MTQASCFASVAMAGIQQDEERVAIAKRKRERAVEPPRRTDRAASNSSSPAACSESRARGRGRRRPCRDVVVAWSEEEGQVGLARQSIDDRHVTDVPHRAVRAIQRRVARRDDETHRELRLSQRSSRLDHRVDDRAVRPLNLASVRRRFVQTATARPTACRRKRRTQTCSLARCSLPAEADATAAQLNVRERRPPGCHVAALG